MPSKPDHSQRWKTAAILLAIVAVIGYLDLPFLTWLFLGLIYLLAYDETMKLLGLESDELYLYALGLWILLPALPHPADASVAGLLLFAALLAYRRSGETGFVPLLYPSLGIFYLWGLYAGYGMNGLLWLLVIVALTDVGAYYSGRKLGKTPFSPTSPNKTLEGVAGGVVAGTLGGALTIGLSDAPGWSLLPIAAAVSLAAVFGDLFESWLKRRAGVKDSGTVLPGHGGILDRIDGYLFSAPVLYILLKMTGS